MNRGENKVEAGVLAAVLTPVDDALAPATGPWLAHCRWLLDQGCDGLAVLGTTSEANSFSVAERLALLDALAEGGIPGGRLIPGTGCCAIPDTVALTRKALEIGAAGVLMLPPFYYKGVSDDGLFAAYAEVIERVGDAALKIYLYHIPPMSNVPITYGLIEKLRAAYPDTVVGIKDSSGDFANMTGMVDAFPGFRVFSGADTFLLPLLRAGGAGAITACNNVSAALSVKVYAGWRGDGADADQAALDAVRNTVQKFPLVAALKEIVANATGDDAWRRQRPPLELLTPEQSASLMEELSTIGFAPKIAA
ncbi:MAG: dihydrodipicolinate synthase family protein [Alphaproteobacteria bacterium]